MMRRNAVLLLSAIAAGGAAAPSRPMVACDTAIGRAIAHGRAADVPAACWRIGPVTLGQSPAVVERRLGAPVARGFLTAAGPAGGAPRRYQVTLHALRVAPGPLVQGGLARFRLVELRYQAGRLAAIDTAPGGRIEGDRCPAADAAAVKTDAPVSAFASFAGAKVGDPVASLRRRFAQTPFHNRSDDWYSYLPVPISFGADEDRNTIADISIATDDIALTTSSQARLHLHRDPATCRLTSIDFALAQG